MTLRHSRWLVVLLLTLGLFLVACSSNDGDDAGDDNGNGDAEEPTRSEDSGADDDATATEDEDDADSDDDATATEDDGGDDDNGSSGDGGLIERARERAQEQAENPGSGEAYAFEMNATFEGLEIDPETTEGFEVDVSEFRLVGNGAVDPGNQRSQFTFTIEGFDLGDLDGLEGFEDFFTFETIQDGDVLYTKNPLLTLFGGGDEDTWIRAEGGAGTDELGQPLDVPGFDAGSQLDALQGLSDEFEEVGEEEIRGVDTTHIRATIDAERLQQELEENLDDPSVAEDLRDLYGEDVTIDLWLDDDGRVHRMEAEYAFAGTAADEAAGAGIDFSNATMHMVIEYFDYGDSIDIELPSEDQIISEDEIFGGFGDLLTPEE